MSGPVEATPPDADGSVGAVEAAEAAVEGLVGAVSLAPSSVMPALGGELVLPSPPDADAPTADVASDSVRAGLLQAGPLAVAGVLASGTQLIVTVLLARLLTNRNYGALNQLTGLFLIVSMPGSAVIVAVVRRVTAWQGSGSAHLVQRWARRVHRQGTMAVVCFAVVVVSAGNWLAHLLNQRHALGVDAILVAGAIWVLLCLDRGLLQAHRNYRTLAANLLVEGGVRTVAMITLVLAGLGVVGAALGVLVAEVVTAVHARLRADRVWADEVDLEEARGEPGPLVDPGGRGAVAGLRRRWATTFSVDRDLLAPVEQRRDLVTDLAAALVALAMVALLQNIDVIVIGRDAPRISGSYAAVSVASKALVFGALVLGSYLLPEAAIRWRQGGHALRQLAVTLLLLAVPSLLLLGIALGAPRLLLSVVFSARYLGAQAALVPLVLAMVCLSVTVILTMYLLAVGRRWITVLLVIGALAATVAVSAAHGRPRATAVADLGVQACLALVTVIGFVRVHHRRRARR